MPGHETSPSSPPDGCGDCSRDGGALRCACGSLLARFVAGQIELKCRRCKRTVLIDIDIDGADGSA